MALGDIRAYLGEHGLLPQQWGLDSFEQPSFMTRVRRLSTGYTPQELALLQLQGKALDLFMDQERLKQAAELERELAPKAATAKAIYGIPLESSQYRPMEDTSFVGPMPAMPTPEGPVEGPRTRMVPDPEAKLFPWQVHLWKNLQEGRGVIEGDRFVPTPLARSTMSPEEIRSATALMRATGALPRIDDEALRQIETPLPTSVTGQLLQQASQGDGYTFHQMTAEEGPGLYAIPKGLTGAPKKIGDVISLERAPALSLDVAQQLLTFGLDPKDVARRASENDRDATAALQDAMKRALQERIAVEEAKTRAEVLTTQATRVLPPKEASHLIDKEAYAQYGMLKFPDGPVTEREAGDRSKYAYIGEKEKDAISRLTMAKATVDAYLDATKELIKAKSAGASFYQAIKAHLGAFTRANPVAAAVIGDRKPFASWLARLVEVGVLTDDDLNRWEKVLPTERDTVASAQAKIDLLRALFHHADMALREIIVGTDRTVKDRAVTRVRDLSRATEQILRDQQRSPDQILDELRGR